MRVAIAFAAAIVVSTCLGIGARAAIVANGGIESPDVGGPIYLTPDDWTKSFTTAAPNDGVLMTDGGGFVGPSPPQGSQAIVLQTTISGTQPAGIKQDILLSASTIYQLDFFVAQSVLTPSPAGSYTITLDGTPIASGTPVVGTYTPISTTFNNLVAGSHSLSLNNVTVGVDMYIAFDAVSVTLVGPIPEPGMMTPLAAGLLTVFRRARRK